MSSLPDLGPSERISLLSKSLDMVKHQNETVQSWIRSLAAIQGGAAVLLGAVLKEFSSPEHRYLLLVAGILVPLLVIAVSVMCIWAAIRDLQWQGHYAGYVKLLDPTGTFYQHLSIDVSIPPSGYGAQARALVWVARGLVVFWIAVVLVSVAKWVGYV
jgi:hypothetical protein